MYQPGDPHQGLKNKAAALPFRDASSGSATKSGDFQGFRLHLCILNDHEVYFGQSWQLVRLFGHCRV